MFNNFFFFENRAVYEMSKNMIESEMPQMATQCGEYALDGG